MIAVKSLIAGVIGALVSLTSAYAADPAGWPPPPEPVRPVSPVSYRWSGVYVGGQLGISSAGMDFRGSNSGMVEHILRNDVVLPHVSDWLTLTKVDNVKTTYGGFIGFNSQWDGNLILGAELNYSRAIDNGFFGSSSDSMTRVFNDDAVAPAQHHYFYTATVGGSASARLTDFGTLRVRAGMAFDNFLPYAYVGAALGRVDVTRTATAGYVRHDIPDLVAPPTGPLVPIPDFTFSQTMTDTKNGLFAYGYAAGLGIDIALTSNIFVRAEAEYLQFAPVEGIKMHISSGRVGVGLKF